MMDATFPNVIMNLYKDDNENELNEMRAAVLSLAKGTQRDFVGLFRNIESKWKKQTEKGTIEKFKFEPNDQTLSQWKTSIATANGVLVSKANVHWKIIHGQAYKNVNADSWEKDIEVECARMIGIAKSEAQQAQKELTEPQLKVIWSDTADSVKLENWNKALEVQEWVPLARGHKRR